MQKPYEPPTLDTRQSEHAKVIRCALDELAKAGSDMCTLLHAVSCGGCLELSNEQATGAIVGVIQSSEGRYHRAKGPCVAGVIGELADAWKRYAEQTGEITTASLLPDTERPPPRS